MKFLKWLGIILLALVILLLVGINLLAPRFRMPDEKIESMFEEEEMYYDIRTAEYKGNKIRWTEAGNPDAGTLMLMFHGAPGGFGDYSDYMMDSELSEKTLMVNMDRLGYGYSDYGDGEPSIIEHVEAGKFVLDHYNPDTIILVGYSYGGPIAGSFAGRHPEKLKALLMLAPVNAPDAEKIFWFNPILNTAVAKLVLPGMINTATVEKMNHAKALDAIRGDWSKITVPVVHMHCTDDWIAPYEPNVAWSRENISEDLLQHISWEGDSHFLPNQVKDRIKPVMMGLLDR